MDTSLKKVYARRFVTFYMLLGSFIHKAIFVILQEDGANVSIHKGGVFFHQRDTQFMYHFNEQHST